MQTAKSKKVDIVVLLSLLVVAPTLSLLIKADLLTSIIFFYGLPALWLSARCFRAVKRAAIVSLLGTAIFIAVDYIATIEGGWVVSTIFQYRPLGILAIENSLFFFLGAYTVIMFYEYFDEKSHHFHKTKLKLLFLLSAVILTVFFIILYTNPEILIIKYSYLWILIFFLLIPDLFIFITHKKWVSKFLKANLYMIGLNLPFEIVALHLGQWSFPGHFIGWVQILNYRFPVEEFIFYILAAGMTILVWYEFFADDCE